MTENMKKLLEIISRENRESVEKLNQASREELIAWAAGKGITLTDVDFEKEESTEGEVSLDDADSVAGGKDCYCAFGAGGGTSTNDVDACGCVLAGYGDDNRCTCYGYGQGKTG
ncbi:MAG: hypothetical protein IKE16_01725 [Solobacterium sp.]|nr:hypothetical protein [Solobacterium sp.]